MPGDRSPAARYLADSWSSLVDFNFQWVASNAEQVLAHDEDLASVMDAVLYRWDPASVVYAFVDFERVERFGEDELS